MTLEQFIITIPFIALALASNDTDGQTKTTAQDWFQKREWLGGLKLTPHPSIDAAEFAKQYGANPERWKKAFAFIKDHDLDSIQKGKYPIEGDTVFASITEDSSKDFEKTKWESHRKYVDLQYVIRGEEKIGVWPVAKSTVTMPYDEKRDVANYSAEGTLHSATPGTFFLFFLTDAHRPNITPGGNKVVKKLVIKILYSPR